MERLQRIFGACGGLGHASPDSPTLNTSEQVYISSFALLKMLKHGRAGAPMEVMGLMLGEFVDEYTVRVVDVFAMPQSGTGVSVEAVDHVFQTNMLDMFKQTGRPEMVVGWYHELGEIGGNMVPCRIKTSHNTHGRSKSPKFQESSYMDPAQTLCLGALFDIAATNGLDMGRRLCIYGFCRSVEMLSDVVEDTVLEHGGEIVAAEKESKGGLQEKLTMTVAVPYLWGVPPAAERLHLAVRTGGGIVDKVYWQWHFL